MKPLLNRSLRFGTSTVDDTGLREHESSSHSIAFRTVVSRIISQIMRKNAKLNSLAWNVILRSYDLLPFSKLIAFVSGFTMGVSTQFGLFRFRPVFVNEILMAL